MFKLRYYCQAKGKEELRELLMDIEAKHNISYETLDVSRNGAYDEEKERQVYERDFKPKARILKKRTGESIRKELRGSKGKKHYYVSTPGTMTVVRDGEIEWYTVGDEEIIRFLKMVLSNGHVFLKECCR